MVSGNFLPLTIELHTEQSKFDDFKKKLNCKARVSLHKLWTTLIETKTVDHNYFGIVQISSVHLSAVARVQILIMKRSYILHVQRVHGDIIITLELCGWKQQTFVFSESYSMCNVSAAIFQSSI